MTTTNIDLKKMDENLKGLVVINEFTKHDTDPVKRPSHYQGRYGMEAIDVVKNFSACPEYEEGFYWGNAVKYMLRWHRKNGLEDLKKARQNLDWLIEKLKGDEDDD